jgi:hypothetical protein
MSDEHDLHESPLDPAEDARIRGLLADARHAGPMPADVVARMDRLLDGLATERAPIAPVVDLARRRRTAAKLLVAAAAVVVAGVGAGQVLPHLSGGSSADSPTAAEAQDAGGAGADSAEGGSKVAPSASDAPRGPQGEYAANALPIHSERFGADVRKVRARADSGDNNYLLTAPGPTCLTAPVGAGTVLAATYDGAAAALVLRPPTDDSQVVDLYLCGETDPVRSITLPAP